MSKRETIIQQVEDGKPIFMKLFALSDKELIEKIKSYGNKSVNEVLDQARVIRTIVNEDPESIKFSFYDSVELDWLGMSYKPEHGQPSRVLVFAEKKNNEFLEFINKD